MKALNILVFLFFAFLIAASTFLITQAPAPLNRSNLEEKTKIIDPHGLRKTPRNSLHDSELTSMPISQSEVSKSNVQESDEQFPTFCNKELNTESFNETVFILTRLSKSETCPKAYNRLKSSKSLKLANLDISDIYPLRFFPLLEHLDLNKNYISDLEPLKHLKNLKSLNISFNLLEDLSPISQLKNLEKIILDFNEIDDISPLASFTKLQLLQANHNHIENISPISLLMELNSLSIWENPIESEKNSYNCPTGKHISPPVNKFCTSDINQTPKRKYKLHYADKLKNKNRSSVFPKNSVEIWGYDTKSRKIILKTINFWIRQAKLFGDSEVLMESIRISKLLKHLLKKSDDSEISHNERFLVAIAAGTIQGISLISDNSRINNAKHMEFITVAPHNLGLDTGGLSYRYVGSSLIERALDLSSKITLEPASEESLKAYLKIGFSSIDEFDPLEDLGDGVLQGKKAVSLLEKLQFLRSKNEE